ncbi:MAG: helix-turn-helix domain-containing protein [Nitriliruptorales bacterium]|nr:helix-turn-helix domain-containing protein [Nitriliruptorales bacterium]
MPSYGQYCPVARASEIVTQRWTPLIIRELLAGARHFNEIHAGVPRMSPSLLSNRLKDLERVGLVSRDDDSGRPAYHLTQAGLELEPTLLNLGEWGQRWMGEIQDEHTDPIVLMKDIRTYTDPDDLPDRQTTIEVRFPDVDGPSGIWWLVSRPDEGVEVCDTDPGHDVDLWLSASVRALTEVWLGDITLDEAVSRHQVSIDGDARVRAAFANWFVSSPFAEVPRATRPLSRS